MEKQVKTRTEIDMVNEAARLLSSVAPYTAYARLEKKEVETGAWTGKVRMEKLVGVAAGALARAQSAVEPCMGTYTRTREEIRQAIEERRSRVRTQAPDARIEAQKRAEPPQMSVSEPEEGAASAHAVQTRTLRGWLPGKGADASAYHYRNRRVTGE